MSADGIRPDRESYARQDAACMLTRQDLGDCLDRLAAEAHQAARTMRRRKWGRGSATDGLPALYALVEAVKRGEEAVDLADLDRATAAGADA
jgi:hypothetical protein